MNAFKAVYSGSTSLFEKGGPGSLFRRDPAFKSPERYMRESLAHGIAVYGPNHPNVAIRLVNLAEVLTDEYRNAEAQPLFERAFEILRESLPENIP